MILEELTLHNFCLYRGKQTLCLSPSNRSTPVVLVGGLNGAGKTTILDAVQLVLYGPRAQVSKRDGMTYEAYLRECINNSVPPKDGASLALTFLYVSEGEQHTYEVRRAWAEKRKNVRETVTVYKDGEHDRHLSEHWSDIVEELIPLGISRLFFFDAEQVRFLADDETSSRTLGTAVKSLLGLDLAERLIADASLLENRLAERIVSVAMDPDFERLQTQLSTIENELKTKKDHLAGLENKRQRANEAKRQAEAHFEQYGGKHWTEREARQKELTQTADLEARAREDLIRIAATELPFALVPELVALIDQQDRLEQAGREAAIVQDVLCKRDQHVVESLRSEGVDGKTIALVRKIQRADRAVWQQAATAGIRHGLSEAARATVRHLRNGALAGQLTAAGDSLGTVASAAKKREQLERSLKMTPDDVSIIDVFERLKTATANASGLSGEAKWLEDEIKSLRFQRDECDRKMKAIQRKKVDAAIQSDEATRMLKLATRTQGAMQEFLKRSTIRKIGRLSQLVGEAFQFLLRKQSLIQRVEIDPESFRIALFDTDGNVVSKERLSEGEKQIFAISVLWGLAKASPRALPAIIDTPMARLDTDHRAHLVERYFPHASHQVIVLSTDTEIDHVSYRRLRQHISHSYHLSYDDEHKATTVNEGYFPALNKKKARNAK